MTLAFAQLTASAENLSCSVRDSCACMCALLRMALSNWLWRRVAGEYGEYDSMMLTGASDSQSNDGSHIVINMGDVDLNELKRRTLIGTTSGTTFASASDKLIDDLMANQMVEIGESIAIQSRNYLPDSTRPRILAYSVDLSGHPAYVDLLFSETVRADYFNANGITFQGAGNQSTSSMSAYQLTGGKLVSPHGTSLKVELTEDDLNELKKAKFVLRANAMNSTNPITQPQVFASVDSSTFRDMNNNSVDGILASSAMEANAFFQDTTRPTLASCSLSMSSGKLVFGFSETVLSSSVATSGVYMSVGITNGVDTPFFLSAAGTTVDTSETLLVTITLNDKDMNGIKAITNLATAKANTFCTLQDGSVTDMNSVAVKNVGNFSPKYTADTVEPELKSFSLDMSTETLLVTFTETVDASSFEVKALTFHGTTALSSTQYPLKAGTVQQPAMQSPVISIKLNTTDLNAMKKMRNLLTEKDNTHLALTTAAVRDMNSNTVVASTVAMKVADFKGDGVAPKVLQFDLDLQNERLDIEFSETMDMTTLSLEEKQITLSAAATAGQATESYTLRFGVFSKKKETKVSIVLQSSDLNALKQKTGLATSDSTTFLVVTNATIRDTFGNMLTPITSEKALKVRKYTEDKTEPKLVDWDFDVNAKTITLEFDETVLAASLEPKVCTIQASQNKAVYFNLTADSTVTTQNDSTKLTITVGNNDMNTIKQLTALATEKSNSWLSFTDAAVLDMNNNKVVAVSENAAKQVDTYTIDKTAPKLLGFDLDMDGVGNSDPLLTLSFDETVLSKSLKPSNVMLYKNAALTGGALALQDINILSTDGPVVKVSLNITDANELKRMRDLATKKDDTYLRILKGGFTDMVALDVEESKHKVGIFGPDNTDPTLVSFGLDMSTLEIALTFDETVDSPGSIVYSRYSFVGGDKPIPLPFGSSVSTDGTKVVIKINPDDADTLKLDTNVASAEDNTVLHLSKGGIADAVGNSIDTTVKKVAAGGFQRDAVAPTLLKFSVAMDDSTITLNFDEPVDATKLNATRFTLLSDDKDTQATERYALKAGSTTSGNGRQIVLKMTVADMNAIKKNDKLYHDEEASYLQMAKGAILDMASNEVVAIGADNAKKAERFLADITAPQLQTYDLNMKAGTLTLHFLETVDASSLKPKLITLQKGSGAGAASHTLRGGTFDGLADHVSVELTLTRSDLDEIKRKQVALTKQDTWLVAKSGTIVDMNKQKMPALVGGVNAKPVTTYTTDNKLPVLDAFDLSMDLFEAVLVFSETVKVSSLQVDTIVFESTSTAGAGQNFRLSAASSKITAVGSDYAPKTDVSKSSNVDGHTVYITIGLADMNNIKRQAQLAQAQTSTFVTFTGDKVMVKDMFSNDVVPQIKAPLLQARKYEADTVDPTMTKFEFDMSGVTARLSMWFSETVDASTFNATEIVLQSGGASGTQYKLKGGTRSQSNATMHVDLAKTDLDEIKRLSALATSKANTFIVFADKLVSDMATIGNTIAAVDTIKALQVDRFAADITPPVLESFALNMTSEILTMAFSETVKAASIDYRKIFLVGSACAKNPAAEPLSDEGNLLSADGLEVAFKISTVDGELIKEKTGLATGMGNTLIAFDASAITDMALVANGIAKTADCKEQPVKVFGEDKENPTLTSFSISMSDGEVVLTFSEVMDCSSFNETHITFQDAEKSPSDSYKVQKVSVSECILVRDTHRVVFKLSYEDKLNIQANTKLLVSAGTSFISVTPGVMMDMNKNSVVAVTGHKADKWVKDGVQPKLVSCSINMNSKKILLKFDETIEQPSITGLMLTNAKTQHTTNVSLASADDISLALDTMDVTTTTADLNRIKFDKELCTSEANCFVYGASGLVQDKALNSLFTASEATPCKPFVKDSISPELADFVSFDRNAGSFVLQFNEVVDVGSVRLKGLEFHDAVDGSGDKLSLNGGSELNGSVKPLVDSTDVTFYLSNDDMNTLKLKATVCVRASGCYIRFSSSFVKDMAGNQITAVKTGTLNKKVYPTKAITADSTPPELKSFALDMESATCTLVFDEPVSQISFRPSFFKFSNAATTGAVTEEYALKQTNAKDLITTSDGDTMKFNIQAADITALKELFNLATNSSNTFVTGSNYVDDMSKVSGNVALFQASVVPDSTPPTVTKVVKYDANNGRFILAFSEPVQLTTVDPSKITFQPTKTSSQASHTLSHKPTSIKYVSDKQNIEIAMHEKDLGVIKNSFSLAITFDSTFVSLEEGVTVDGAGLAVAAIKDSDALDVDNVAYVPDLDAPEIVEFGLDMNTEQLVLVFDDIVKMDSFGIPNNVELLHTKIGTADVETFYMLGKKASVATNDGGYTVNISLAYDDVQQIKYRPRLATVLSNTFIALKADTVNDVKGINMIAITRKEALKASFFVEDSTSPEVKGVELNMNSGIISVSFSEFVDVNTFTPADLTFQGALKSSRSLAAQPNTAKACETACAAVTVPGQVYTPMQKQVSTTHPTACIFGCTIESKAVSYQKCEESCVVRYGKYTSYRQSIYDDTALCILGCGSYWNFQPETVPTGSAIKRTSTEVSDVLTAQMNTQLMNQMKQALHIASGAADTFITFSSKLVKDMNQNDLIGKSDGQAMALNVAGYTKDKVPPTLVSFDLNMDQGILFLTFSETVQASSVNVKKMTLYTDATKAGASIPLTGATVSSYNEPTVRVYITHDDLNTIKQTESVAVSKETTYLAFDDGMVSDTSGNTAVAAGTSAANWVADGTNPWLISADLDLSTHLLSFKFSETVLANSVNVSGLKISGSSSAGSASHTLTAGAKIISQSNSEFVVVELTNSDINNLKMDTSLAVDASSTHIDFGTKLIKDMSNNAIDAGSAIAGVHKPDSVLPVLKAYTLDMNAGKITLTFSEVVNGSSFDPTHITLQNKEVRQASTLTYKLTSEVTCSKKAAIVDQLHDGPCASSTLQSVSLNLVDMNEIKKLYGLAVTEGTTYVSMTENTIFDMNTNAVEAVASSKALLAGKYVKDSTNPKADSFSVNMDTGVINVTFSETVDALSLAFASVRVQGSLDTSSTSHFTLEKGTILNINQVAKVANGHSPATEIFFQMTVDDMNKIKAATDLYTNDVSSYLSFAQSSIQDMQGNPLDAIVTTKALKTTVFVKDTTSPKLVEWDFNVDTKTITAEFDETVLARSLTPAAFRIGGTSVSVYVNLTADSTVTTQNDSTKLTITVGNNDMNTIKQLTALATEKSNSWLSFTDAAVLDMNNNKVVAVSENAAKQVDTYTIDKTAPKLLGFDLDMDGVGNSDPLLTLSFDETVLSKSLKPSNVMLYKNAALTGGALALQDINILSTDGPVVKVSLNITDANELKRMRDLATKKDDTYLRILKGGFTDMVALDVEESKHKVGIFGPDNTDPTLVSFGLDMSTLEIALTFDETVDSPGSIVYSRYSFVGGDKPIPLPFGSSVSTDGTKVVIKINPDDADTLKLDTNVASAEDNTVLHLSKGGIADAVGNSIDTTVKKVAAGGFQRDAVAPTLLKFSVAMDDSTITLNFDEPVDATKLNATRFTLLSDDKDTQATERYALKAGSTTSGNGRQIVLKMTVADMNAIKKNDKLYHDEEASYLQMAKGAILDMASNEVVAIGADNAKKAERFLADITAPQLQTYDLNMKAGTLTLHFLETVDASSLKPKLITLQKGSGAGAASHTLRGGTFDGLADHVSVELTLTRSDLDEIKRKQVALTKQDTWLVAKSGTIVDMNKQKMPALVGGVNAKPVTTYTTDNKLPVLDAFDLSMDLFEAVLVFSETVKVSSLQVDTIVFESTSTAGAGQNFRLSAASSKITAVGSDYAPKTDVSKSSNVDGHTVYITIGLADMNNIKRQAQLAQAQTSTFVTFTGDKVMVKDMFSNDVVPQIKAPLLQARKYEADTVDPTMTKFEFDMSGVTARLSMWFSETVDASTFNATEIVLQSGGASGTQYKLKGGTRSQSNATMHVDLAKTDLDEIKRLSALATSKANTFIVFADKLVSDMATIGNTIAAVDTIKALQVDKFAADITPPVLENFALDLTKELVTLSFSETVNANSLDTGSIYLQNNKCADKGRAVKLTKKDTVLSVDGLEIQFRLVDKDMDIIKQYTDLLTKVDDTYIRLGAGAVFDMATTSNKNLATASCKASQIKQGRYFEDLKRPLLSSWDLNMAQQNLYFYFSESINADKLSIPAIRLEDGATLKYNLTDSKVIHVANPPTSLVVHISDTDMNNIKETDSIGKNHQGSQLYLTSALAKDMNNNELQATGTLVKARNFYGDNVEPTLVKVNLDMTDGKLELFFSERVRLSSLDLSALVIYGENARSPNVPLMAKPTTATLSADGTSVLAALATADLNKLKLEPSIAVSRVSVRISANSSLVKDMQGNAMVKIPADLAKLLKITGWKQDDRKPSLVSFDIDLTTQKLSLSFDEAVDAKSFNVTGIRVQENKQAFDSGTYTVPDYAYRLTDGAMVSTNGPIIVVTLTTYDLDRIKRLSQLAISKSTTFITVDPATIADLNSNQINTVADGKATEVTNYITDKVAPRLTSFKIIMDKEGPPLKLRLRFSETVNVTTFDVTKVILQDKEVADQDTESHRLTGGNVATVAMP